MLRLSIFLAGVFFMGSCRPDANPVSVNEQGVLSVENGAEKLSFVLRFVILFTEKDPKPAMRPAGIENVPYNVITWQAAVPSAEQLEKVQRQKEQAGDGFDSGILEGDVKGRSANLFAAGEKIWPELEQVREEKGHYFFTFRETPHGLLKAELDCTGEQPILSYEFSASKPGYYSVGYMGAPSYAPSNIEELWQPLIWQEKRLPETSFMTLAFRCPLPATLATNGMTYGVIAHPEEFPFDPLPVMNNSRFGVAVLNQEKEVQPMLFAPVMGGVGSKMQAGDNRRFKMILWAEKSSITASFEHIATRIYGFKDYRHNDLSSLNQTLENMVSYSLSDYSWFVDSLKGYAYSTDVPGAVKNVSSLHPLEIALVMGLPEMFDKRAWPLIEYMLSRQKFLFSLDREQKIQSPSRNLYGPVAPVSELSALYNITGRKNDYLLQMAAWEYDSTRIRNLDVMEQGNTWQNALAMYRANGEAAYLEKAREGADAYIRQRIEQPQTRFDEQEAFFWTGFAPKWVDLLRLYETTAEKAYLEAAREGARRYAMFCWMSPRIPDDSILVNKGGKAPMYGYLRNKGHKQMYGPEELAPAWRLSETGLTPESSGTSTGHRAIFMANYAPWMLRLGYYARDRFLMNIAKAAVIGRYRNFPGYHINTARTTIYEKEDYPLRPHKELSVNSFHYNHILPMASMLLDYLVTDAIVRSEENIDFPDEFIEGYAYLQNKFYGFRPGAFYGDTAWLWMPAGILSTSSKELNYITARGDRQLMAAFANQSDKEVKAEIKLNTSIIPSVSGREKEVEIWVNNRQQEGKILKNGTMTLTVPAYGITALKIKDVEIDPGFQAALLSGSNSWKNAYAELALGNARAMILEMGNYKTAAYIYLRDDDSVYKEASIEYRTREGEKKTLRDRHFPYEFTVPLHEKEHKFSFMLSGVKLNGEKVKSQRIEFKKEKTEK